jgi:hypothetical protein
MDGSAFDAIVRRTQAHDSRRGVLRAGLQTVAALSLGLLGLSAAEKAAAKQKGHKNKKKRKKNKRKTCSFVGLQQYCPSSERCCTSKTGAICADNGCRSDGLPSCCLPTGAACSEDCDCCGEFSECFEGVCF